MTEMTTWHKLNHVLEYLIFSHPRLSPNEATEILSAIYPAADMKDNGSRIKALNEVTEVMDNLNDAGLFKMAYVLGVQFNLHALMPQRDHASSCAIHLRMADHLLDMPGKQAQALWIMKNALNDAKRLGNQYLTDQVACRFHAIEQQSLSSRSDPPSP